MPRRATRLAPVICAILTSGPVFFTAQALASDGEGPTIDSTSVASVTKHGASPRTFAVSKLSLAGIPQHDETLGSPRAPVKMLLFNDPQSPISRMWHVQVLPSLVRKYVKVGKLQIQWHGFAVIGPASVAGEDFIAAAGLQNHLWDMLDEIMVNQGIENSGWLNLSLVEQIGTSIHGFNVAKAVTDAGSPAVAQEIRSDVHQGEKDGLVGVPFILVGRRGKPLKPLAFTEYTPADFEGPIDRLLRKR